MHCWSAACIWKGLTVNRTVVPLNVTIVSLQCHDFHLTFSLTKAKLNIYSTHSPKIASSLWCVVCVTLLHCSLLAWFQANLWYDSGFQFRSSQDQNDNLNLKLILSSVVSHELNHLRTLMIILTSSWSWTLSLEFDWLQTTSCCGKIPGQSCIGVCLYLLFTCSFIPVSATCWTLSWEFDWLHNELLWKDSRSIVNWRVYVL